MDPFTHTAYFALNAAVRIGPYAQI